jgi:hypothetical protein
MGDPLMAKKLTHKQFSELGHRAFMKKYGKEKYSEMGKKGAAVKSAKDPNYFNKFSLYGVRGRLKSRLEKGTISQEEYNEKVAEIELRLASQLE